MRFYKYQGAGNDFLLADNRDGHIMHADGVLSYQEDGMARQVRIVDICDRRYGIGADGLMLLESSEAYDFRMTYFNSDGSGGMMCGNGGRCIVAFAADLGLTSFEFEAADGYHAAEVVTSEGKVKTVRLKMKDVSEMVCYDSLTGVSVPSDGCFVDTGTRHFVRMVSDCEGYDVVAEGRDIRWNAGEFLPVGVNVNFVEPSEEFIKVRTYEKGVEDETFACGTGIVASAVFSCLMGVEPARRENERYVYSVKARRDDLKVDFAVHKGEFLMFKDVWLTGPAVYVAEIVWQ